MTDVLVLRRAGLTDAQIVAVVAEEQAERREAQRQAQRRYRANLSNKNNDRVISQPLQASPHEKPQRNQSPRYITLPSPTSNNTLPLKILTSSDSQRTQESEQASLANFGARVSEILREMPPQPDNAQILHIEVEKALEANGLDVEREHRVELDGEGFGFIDLVVHADDGSRVAIELDRRLPRAKSLKKLVNFDGYRIAVVRSHKIPAEFVGTVDAVIAIPPLKADSRGTRIPENWDPGRAGVDFALGVGVADVGREADRFRDYWAARAGQGGVKLDWQATWRNWCRKAAENNRGNGKRTVHQACDEALERLRALNGSVPPDLRNGASQGSLRLLPAGRCE